MGFSVVHVYHSRNECDFRHSFSAETKSYHLSLIRPNHNSKQENTHFQNPVSASVRKYLTVFATPYQNSHVLVFEQCKLCFITPQQWNTHSSVACVGISTWSLQFPRSSKTEGQEHNAAVTLSGTSAQTQAGAHSSHCGPLSLLISAR